MLVLLKDCQKIGINSKSETKIGTGLAQSVVNDTFMYVRKEMAGREKNVWVVPQELYGNMYRDDEWSQIIKSLRVADDNIHHLRFTNTYFEKNLNAFCEDTKNMKKMSEHFSQQLYELSALQSELTKSMSKPGERTKGGKTVKFSVFPRKSKSAEYHINQMCSSCGLVLNDNQIKTTKIKRKKDYGKFCSSCGTIEVSSQNSMAKCYECDGEIVIQGLCSSCDSIKGQIVSKNKKRSPILVDKACSTCDFLRKNRACWDEIKMCNKCRKAKSHKQHIYICHEKRSHRHFTAQKEMKYVAESSYCSDCDFTSSCETSLTDSNHKRLKGAISADSVMPLSDSDNLIINTRGCGNEYEFGSSVSSSGTETRKTCVKENLSVQHIQKPVHEEISLIVEESTSIDDEFATPRECRSTEEIYLSRGKSSLPCKNNILINEINKNTKTDKETKSSDIKSSDSTDSEEYAEAMEPVEEPKNYTADSNTGNILDMSPFEENLLKGVFSQQPNLVEVSNRIHRAEGALEEIVDGNIKLEERINTMDNISQQNLKLSMILREIMLGMAAHLDFMEREIDSSETKDESESSDEFEEALEEVVPLVKNDPDLVAYHEIMPINLCYLCLECGIKISHMPLTKCLTCGRNITEIPNWFHNNRLQGLGTGDSSALVLSNDLTCAIHHNRINAQPSIALPLLVKTDFSNLPLSVLEDKLRLLEKETKMLQGNNNIINVLIDDLKVKIREELQRIKAGKGDNSQSRVVGFDVSFYQVRGHFSEGKQSNGTATLLEKVTEEVKQNGRTFMEMKFEEVFKKEQQTALELEIFEQKLEVEGLIIKEKEDYYTCSDSSQATERMSESWQLPIALSKRFTSEKFHTFKGEKQNDDILISIEIEVDNDPKDGDKKAVRCEYKANIQKNKIKDNFNPRNTEYERILPTITLYPMWTKANQRGLTYDVKYITQDEHKIELENTNRSIPCIGNQTMRYSDGDFCGDEPYFIDINRDDFVEIKAPKFFYGSSDDDDDDSEGGGDCTVEKSRKKFHSIAAVRMPIAIYPVTEIRQDDTPITRFGCVHKMDNAKREFAQKCQIELEKSPTSGVIFLQPEAIPSLGITETGPPASFEEFYETKSTASEFSFQQFCETDSLRTISPMDHSASLVNFVPVNIGGISVSIIKLVNETLPVVRTEVIKTSKCVSITEKEIFAQDEKYNKAEEDAIEPEKEIVNQNEELSKALALIKKIENDVVEVKLHNAIAILPQLESILREHLQEKIKVLKKKSSTMTDSSLDVFMSSLNFMTDDTVDSQDTPAVTVTPKVSDQRLPKMLQLLTGLEKAVREIEPPVTCRELSAQRICDLLKDLGNRIKGIDNEPNLSDMEKTLELTSEVDLAIRKYSTERQKDMSTSETSHDTAINISSDKSSGEIDEGILVDNTMKSMKKKIFQEVALEAREREDRVEKDFDRLDKLEKENGEFMNFLDALLDKTLRRVGELDEIRNMIVDIKDSIEVISSKMQEKLKENQETSPPRVVKVARTPTLPSIQEVSSDKTTSESSLEDKSKVPQDTLSSMKLALDKLKSKAKEKKERYREIFGPSVTFAPNSSPPSEKRNQPVPVKRGRKIKASITQFSKIGADTYYLAWSKPSLNETSIIVGYEILVNGKVNQRVRNPERLRAVLYCVNNTLVPGEKLWIKLYALTCDGRKVSLAELTYPDDGQNLNLTRNSALA